MFLVVNSNYFGCIQIYFNSIQILIRTKKYSGLISAYRAPNWRKPAISQHFKKKKNLFRLNEEIRCITIEGKTAKNEWENDDSDFLPALYNLYKKLGQFFFHTLFANLLKQRYISCVTSYKYLGKLISDV